MPDSRPEGRKKQKGAFLTPASPDKNSVAWKGKNLRYKALALFLAMVLWFYAANEPGGIQDRVLEDLPLVVQGLAPDLIVVGDLPRVQVTLGGKVDGVNTGELIAYLDLTGIPPGEAVLPVQVEVPNRIHLVAIKPNRVKVWVDTWAEKQIPLEIRLSGETAEGYISLLPELKPSQVTLSGAKILISRAPRAYVSLDLQRTDQSLKEMLPVKILDPEGKAIGGLEVKPASAELFVPVVPGQDLKTVSVKPLWQGTPAPGFQVGEVTVEPEKVDLISLPAPLDQIGQISTRPIDISGATENVVQVVALETLSGIKGMKPTEVTVTLQIIKKREDKELAPIKVQVRDRPSHLKAVLKPAEVTLSLQGPEARMEDLKTDDFFAWVSLGDLPEGEHSVPVQVTGPGEVEITQARPEVITVTLTPLEE